MVVTEIPAAEIQLGATRPAGHVTLDNVSAYRSAIACNRLTAQAQQSFDRVLETHEGVFQRYIACQDHWLTRVDAASHNIFVEQEPSRDELFIRVVEQLDLATLKDQKLVVVGAQMVQDIAWSSSTPARILNHVGSSGLSCTVSQCGFSTAYSALEVAVYLCRAEETNRLLLLAGDILPNEYPRLLASSASVSDGVGALLINLSENASTPTMYVVSEANAPAQGLDLEAPFDELRPSVWRVFSAVDALLSHANITARSSVLFCAPNTQIMRELDVIAQAAKVGFQTREAESYQHFGAADMLFRAMALSKDSKGADALPEWVLIWDFDLQAGLALMLVSRDLLTKGAQ